MLVKTSQQLQTTRCSEDDNVREHFDKLANLREQLAAMGKSIADSEYASILLKPLPESYTCILGPIAAAAEMSGTAVSSAVVVKIATDGYDRRTLESSKTKMKPLPQTPRKRRKAIRMPSGQRAAAMKEVDRRGSRKTATRVMSPLRATKGQTLKRGPLLMTTSMISLSLVCRSWRRKALQEYRAKYTIKGHRDTFRKYFVTYRKMNAHPTTAANKGPFQ